jgi:hypothetical protein
MKQFRGCSRDSEGGSEKLRMEGVGGWWSQTLLRLYTLWQVKFQKCVNDCFDVWSSFLYIPPSYQYIQDIECIVYCLEHDYLYLELASYFCSLRSKLGHQYSILKKVKCNKYICMYAHTHHMWVDRHRVKCALKVVAIQKGRF